jgi:hypothetical protein
MGMIIGGSFKPLNARGHWGRSADMEMVSA